MKYIYWLAATLVVVSVLLLFVLPTWMKKEMDSRPVVVKDTIVITDDGTTWDTLGAVARSGILGNISSQWTEAVSASPAYQYQDPLIGEIKKLRKELLVAIEKNKCNHPMLFVIPLEPSTNEVDTSELQLLQQYGN